MPQLPAGSPSLFGIHFTLPFQVGASKGRSGNWSMRGPFGAALDASVRSMVLALALFGVGEGLWVRRIPVASESSEELALL